MTILELILVIALGGVLIGMALMISLSSLDRSRARGAVHEIQSLTQLARMEAISRNRECRLLLSPDSRELQVVDGQGTFADTDDLVLQRATLPPSVQFSRPDGGGTIGWESLGGSPAWFRLRFAADGTVAAGEGDLFLQGAEHYSRLSVFVSGATRISTWKNGAWRAGSY